MVETLDRKVVLFLIKERYYGILLIIFVFFFGCNVKLNFVKEIFRIWYIFFDNYGLLIFFLRRNGKNLFLGCFLFLLIR